MEQKDQIYLDHVTYIYNPGTSFETKALDDVSLGFQRGKITGVIGHTGSGKSTMAQLLNGIAKPTAGKIFLDGKDIHVSREEMLQDALNDVASPNKSKRLLKKEIRKKWIQDQKSLCFRVGLVMQYPEYQLFDETVASDIAFGPKNMGLDPAEIEKRVREAAEFAGIEEELLQKSPFDISGGQKRRVALAGVIAMKPEVLVLDEPAAGLDPQGKSRIFSGIVNYQRTTGSTVIIISHSMEDMAKYCDRIAVLSDAKLLLEGETKDVFSHVEELETTGLDLPQITKLMRTLKEKGVPVPDHIYTVPDAISELSKLFGANPGEES